MFGTHIMQSKKLTTHIRLVLQIMKKWDITYIMLYHYQMCKGKY